MVNIFSDQDLLDQQYKASSEAFFRAFDAGAYLQKLDGFPIIVERVKIQGCPIHLTHKPGDMRHGKQMVGTGYGYAAGTYGKAEDGKSADFYIGDYPNQALYCIKQIDPDTGELDECKWMTGFEDMQAARNCFVYHAGGDRFGGIRPAKWQEIHDMRGQDA